MSASRRAPHHLPPAPLRLFPPSLRGVGCCRWEPRGGIDASRPPVREFGAPSAARGARRDRAARRPGTGRCVPPPRALECRGFSFCPCRSSCRFARCKGLVPEALLGNTSVCTAISSPSSASGGQAGRGVCWPSGDPKAPQLLQRSASMWTLRAVGRKE